MILCPCGSNQNFEQCCQPYLEQKEQAPTPEKLMRSRYTAYAQLNIDYIAATMKGPALLGFDANATLAWAQQVQWLNLKILAAPPVKMPETKGSVEFMARYLLQNQENILHEISEFHFENGRWYYYDGRTPKVDRNDPCPCGSGRKYKKCCYQTPENLIPFKS